jgi:hypothetical protein
MQDTPRVYLNTTRQDLQRYREEAARIVRRHGIQFTVWEQLSIGGRMQRDDLRAGMAECQAMICFLPWDFKPFAAQQSLPMLDQPDAVAWCEIEAAREARVPLYVFWNGAGKTPPVLPILQNDAETKEGLDSLDAPVRFIHANDLESLSAEIARIAGGIAQDVWGHITPAQRPPKAVCFTGRAADVAWLEQQLRSARSGARISLVGGGGMGKTAIACEAISRVSPDADPFSIYPGGLYVHDFYAAPSCRAFMDSVLRAAGHADADEATHYETVTNLLSAEHCLVYAEGVEKLRDNARGENLAALFELCGRAVVLLTSRHTLDAWGTISRDVSGLALEEAAALLAVHAGASIADGDFKHLSDLLGAQPLALSLAGTYLRLSETTAAKLQEELLQSGFASLPPELRPVESLRFLFRCHAAALSATAREAWFALCLHGLSVSECDTIAACLGVSEEPARAALDELATHGVAAACSIRVTVSGLVEHGWRLAHSRFAEWGRSRLADFGVNPDAIIVRWKMHWFAMLGVWWEAELVPGEAERHQMVFEHMQAFIASLQRLEGDASVDLFRALKECGRVCFLMKRDGDARDFAEKALSLNASHSVASQWETLDCLRNLGLALQDIHQNRSLQILEETLASCRLAFGKGDELTLAVQRSLALVLEARHERGDSDRAGALLREAYEMCLTSLEPGSAETSRCRTALADFAFRCSGFASAAPLYRTIIESFPLAEGEIDLAPVDILEVLAYVLNELNDRAGAIANWRRVLDIHRRSAEPWSHGAMNVRFSLVSALAASGLQNEAETLAEEIAGWCRRNFPANDEYRLSTEQFLTDLREGQGS